MTSVIVDLAAALGVPERTVRSALNEAAIADAVFELTERFRLPQRAAYTHIGLTEDQFKLAATRAFARHRTDMIEQQRAALSAKTGTPRKRNEPVGDPPSKHHRWCTRGRHWVHESEMTRNSTRQSGFSDWCKPCGRDYWFKFVRPKQARRRS